MNDPVQRQDFDKALATLKSTVQRVFPTDTRRPGRTVSMAEAMAVVVVVAVVTVKVM